MIFASSSPLPLMLRPCSRAVSAAGMRLARGKRMKNVDGTEVISRALQVLFVAGLLLDDLLHCNSHPSWHAAGHIGSLTSLVGDGRLARRRPEDLRTCALHAQTRSPSTAGL